MGLLFVIDQRPDREGNTAKEKEELAPKSGNS
jgi:hypothetical protein